MMSQTEKNQKNVVPLPRLVFRIGFAGKAKFSKDPAISEEVSIAVRRALDDVLEVTGGRLAEIAPGTPKDAGREPRVFQYFSMKNPLLRVVTGLCEGADRIAAEAQKDLRVTCADEEGKEKACLESTLAAVIPFPYEDYRESRPSDYVNDFDADAARCEYICELDGIYDKPDPTKVSKEEKTLGDQRRSRGYRAQGTVLLRHSDILVAVADPDQPARPGGTMETVREALAFDLPVLFINFSGGIALIEPAKKLISALSEPGVFHRDWRTSLKSLITQIVADPTTDRQDPGFVGSELHDVEKFLQLYFTNKELPTRKPHESLEWLNGGRWWERFVKLTGWEKKRPTKIQAFSEIKGRSTPRVYGEGPYRRWRERASRLSSDFSGRYRGVFLVNFTLAVFAVALAALSLVLMGGTLSDWASFLYEVGKNAGLVFDTEKSSDGLPVWILVVLMIMAVIKLVCVFCISRNTHKANHEGWNEYGVDTRYLAERLRALFFLPDVGSFQPPAAKPLQYATRVLKQSSVDWLFDAMTRSVSPAEFGNIDGKASTRPKVPFHTVDPMSAVRGLRDKWLGEQILYHDSNARRMGRLDEVTEKAAKWLGKGVIIFVAVDILFVFMELLHWLPKSLHFLPPWLVFFTAVLPAIVASLNGIRFQSECERLAERSVLMRAVLYGRDFDKNKPGGLWGRANRLCLEIEQSRNDPATDPGAWTEQALELAEQVARDFVDEATEWSVLYSKEVSEAS